MGFTLELSIIVRKAYGMAFWNMAGSGCATEFIFPWPTAEMSFVGPEIAANVVFVGKMVSSPDRAAQKKQFVQQMILEAPLIRPRPCTNIHEGIDSRQTRDLIIRALEICRDRHRDDGETSAGQLAYKTLIN